MQFFKCVFIDHKQNVVSQATVVPRSRTIFAAGLWPNCVLFSQCDFRCEFCFFFFFCCFLFFFLLLLQWFLTWCEQHCQIPENKIKEINFVGKCSSNNRCSTFYLNILHTLRNCTTVFSFLRLSSLPNYDLQTPNYWHVFSRLLFCLQSAILIYLLS